MAEHGSGALICLEKGSPINFVEETGVPIDAVVSHSLLESIYVRALHDGAVVIFEGRIRAARCTSVTNKSIEPDYLGIRHRALSAYPSEAMQSVSLYRKRRGLCQLRMKGS